MSDKVSKERIEEYRETFHLFDRNGDGLITSSELVTAMRCIGANPTQAQIDCMFKKMDKNGDGTIDFKEFLEYMGVYLEDPTDRDKLKQSFQVFDQDKNGRISAAELRKVMMTLGDVLTEEEAAQMIRKADKDGSGDIDYDEYVEHMTK